VTGKPPYAMHVKHLFVFCIFTASIDEDDLFLPLLLDFSKNK